jgi:hypothetical protein
MEAISHKLPPDRKRVLVVESGELEDEAAAAVSEAYRLAEAMSRDHDVILAVPAVSSVSNPGFAIVYYNQRNLALLARDSDVVLLRPALADEYDFFRESGKLFESDWGTIIAGVLPGGMPPMAGKGGTAEGSRRFLAWEPPAVGKGPAYYLHRLRYHLQAGGWHQAARRAWFLVRRKLPGRRKT